MVEIDNYTLNSIAEAIDNSDFVYLNSAPAEINGRYVFDCIDKTSANDASDFIIEAIMGYDGELCLKLKRGKKVSREQFILEADEIENEEFDRITTWLDWISDMGIDELLAESFRPSYYGRVLSEAEEDAIDGDIATYDLNKVSTSNESEQVISAMADAFVVTHPDIDKNAYTQKVKDTINKTQANAELLGQYKKQE